VLSPYVASFAPTAPDGHDRPTRRSRSADKSFVVAATRHPSVERFLRMAENNPSRIRVAHICVGLHLGGLENVLVEVARHVDRRRFDLRFIALERSGSAGKAIEACGFEVTALGVPQGVRPGLPFALAALLRRWNADVVHTHNTKPLLYGAGAARLAGGAAAVVHTRHGQRHGAGRRQTVLFNLAARYADRIVSVSRDSQRLALAQGAPAPRLRVIRNGIDLTRFPFTGPSDGGPAVTVARLGAEKDVETLIRAAAIVAAQDDSFRLEIAGDGPRRAPLEALSLGLGLSDRVRFLGAVDDVPRLLARASLFVLPSLTEGIALTLLEAMACGLPTVATRVGGNPEVLADGQTGLLVPAQSPAELAEAILRLRRERETARQMGAEGRRRVEEHFDVRRMVADYQRLYMEVLRDRGRRLRVSA
jgi:glycosyltransferase involved in cell wall biosynthesis